MPSKCFGYVRVSTKEQNLDRQFKAIDDYCKENNITIDERDMYQDKVSGKDFNRDGYQALKHTLRSGDTLIIKELDRLGRDMEQIKEEWNQLIKKGVDVVVIDTPILNTGNKSDLEKTLISNIVFELLSYMAEKERQKIKQRQAEGIKQCLEQGKDYGRPKIEIPEDFEEIYRRWKQEDLKAVEAMDLLGMTKATFYRKVKEYESRK